MGSEAQSASPAPAVFRVAFGWPIFGILYFASIGVVVTLTSPNGEFLVPYVGMSVVGLIQAVCAAGAIFLVVIMPGMKYRVVDGGLYLSGWSSRRIDLESILRIRFKGAMSHVMRYGLGTGIIIDYKLGVTRDRTVYVTPKDVDGFLAAIGRRCSRSGDRMLLACRK